MKRRKTIATNKNKLTIHSNHENLSISDLSSNSTVGSVIRQNVVENMEVLLQVVLGQLRSELIHQRPPLSSSGLQINHKRCVSGNVSHCIINRHRKVDIEISQIR